MKRMICFVGALALTAAAVSAADPEVLWREKLRTVVTVNGLAVAKDTNMVTDAALKTPAFTGQFLFGFVGEGTNAVWVAKGTATNDWVRIAP